MGTAKVANDDNIFLKAIKFALYGIFTVCVWLFTIATTIFAWAVDPKNISGDGGLLNKQAVKDVWIMVRDLLNMSFILVLLFSAFCTIFQVDKWGLKKVWLNILINALLVNFSFPIARFIIDISNVAFYYFVNNLFSSDGAVTGSSIFASIGGSSNLGQLLVPGDYAHYDVAYLVAIIVITFIMGMTLMVIAGLFIVRLVALVMIVMFSPIGFVGYAVPSWSSNADKWWKALFSYSFFAPIMIFIIAISVRITQAIGRENFQSFLSNASNNTTSSDPNWIANAAFFMIPIVILWFGIGVAKSSGIEFADKVVGAVKKGGKWLANAPGHYSGINGGVKKGWENARKDGKIFGFNNKLTRFALKSGVAEREAGIAGFIGNRSKGWTDSRNKIKDEKNKEDIKKKSEGLDRVKMDQLQQDIEDAVAHPPVERDKQIEAAAKVKQAMSRGSSFEKEVEKKIQEKIANGQLVSSKMTAHLTTDPSGNVPTLANGGLQQLPPPPPANATPVELAQYNAKHAEVLDANRKAEAKHKELVQKWLKEKEKLEKEFIQEQKSEFMNSARDLIKNAEDAGKTLAPPPATPTPTPTPTTTTPIP
jgi:hypothetical protein